MNAIAAMRPRPLAAVIMLMLGACTEIARPEDFPPNMEPFTPPTAYARWWKDVEACSGRRGNLDRVNWFLIPNANYFGYRGDWYDAYWWGYQHTILIAEDWANDSAVVRHEMLHDLLNSGDHPKQYFVERCGALLRRSYAESQPAAFPPAVRAP